MKPRIIIIGAGACGLTAGRELTKEGFPVTILEGRHRAGGRIFSMVDHEFPIRIEAGAEFIHGELPVTKSLLSEYKLSIRKLEGSFWQTRTDKVKKENEFISDHHLRLARELKHLTHDVTVEQFLEAHFNGEEFTDLKDSVRGFVSGYDAADPVRASVFAFRDEWLKSDDEDQYRVSEGYGKLIELLSNDCINNGCEILFNHVVKKVDWKRGSVTLETSEGNIFSAEKIIVTVPIGVLLSAREQASINIHPIPEAWRFALQNLGYGGVVKTVLLFNEMFWSDKDLHEKLNHDLSSLGFIFSDAKIPTWWTQYPSHVPLLTGWAGGKLAKELSSYDDERILTIALQSLSTIFQISSEELQSGLLAHKIFNWFNNPFSLGAYTYEVVGGAELKKKMREPIEDTIYFAGEGYHGGSDSGTVEAALSEGFRIARELKS